MKAHLLMMANAGLLAAALSSCGGNSTSIPSAATALPSVVASSAPVAVSGNSSGYSDAVYVKFTGVLASSCAKANTDTLTATFDGEKYSCTMLVSPTAGANAMKAACDQSQSDPTLITKFEETAESCVISSNVDNNAAVAEMKTACTDSNMDSVSATFDEDASTCTMTTPPGYLAKSLKEGCVVPEDNGLISTFEEATATCTIKVDSASLKKSLDGAIAAGKITCTDGSPAGKPSDACIIAAIDKAMATQ